MKHVTVKFKDILKQGGKTGGEQQVYNLRHKDINLGKKGIERRVSEASNDVWIGKIELIKRQKTEFEVAEIKMLRFYLVVVSQTLFGNPIGPVELGNPNTCAETKLCLNFILFRLKK